MARGYRAPCDRGSAHEAPPEPGRIVFAAGEAGNAGEVDYAKRSQKALKIEGFGGFATHRRTHLKATGDDPPAQETWTDQNNS